MDNETKAIDKLRDADVCERNAQAATFAHQYPVAERLRQKAIRLRSEAAALLTDNLRDETR